MNVALSRDFQFKSLSDPKRACHNGAADKHHVDIEL